MQDPRRNEQKGTGIMTLALKREASARDAGLRVINVGGMCWWWDLKLWKCMMESLKETGKSENRTSETGVMWKDSINSALAFPLSPLCS